MPREFLRRLRTRGSAPVVYLVEFGCADWSTHRCGMVRAIRNALIKQGFSVRSGIHQGACENVVSQLGAETVFRLRPWPPFSDDRISGEIETFLAYGQEGADDLSRFLRRCTGRDAVILCTASENEMWALAQWLKTRPARQRPMVFSNFMLPLYSDFGNGDVPNLRGRLLRAATRRLSALVPPDRLHLYAMSKPLVAELRRLTGIRVERAPDPVELENLTLAAADDPRTGPVKIASMGQPKRTKGPDIIAAVAKTFEGQEVVFHVQNWRDETPLGRNVVRHPQGLKQEEFVALLRSCDISLLAYAPEYYTSGGSGLFSEAAAAGHAIVTPAGLSFSHHIESGKVGGVLAASLSADDLAAALRQAISDIETHRAQASQRGVEWSKEHGAKAYSRRVAAAIRAQQRA